MRDEEPIAAVPDVADDAAHSRNVDRNVERMASRRHVLNRYRPVSIQLRRDDTHRSVELCDAKVHPSEMVQRADDSDQAVSAHAEVRAVVEEDDAAERPVIHRWR